MKAEELMVGDWIYLEGNPVRVVGITPSGELTLATYKGFVNINSTLYPECVAFIPISSEILEKNGFVTSKCTGPKSWQLINRELYCSWKPNRLNIRYRAKYPMQEVHLDCQYLHQLQHILRLVGIEKPIEIC